MSVRALVAEGRPAGDLVLLHDMSFVTRRSEETRRYVFALFVGLGVIVSLLTVVIAQLSWRGWEQGMRALLRGEGLLRSANRPDVPEFRPLARDLRELIRDIESERRPRDEDHFAWSPEALRAVLHHELRGQEVIVVSNREPYIHMRKGDAIEVRRPASGLVTALEPIMRACSGTWIAHGSGSADRDVVDRHNRIEVPPGPTGLSTAPRVADQRGGGRLLLRLRQRRAVAALSHRARPADVPDVGLDAVRARQSHLRGGRRQGGDVIGSDRAGPGLSPRAAAAHGPRGAAGRDHHHVLAHPVAESRGVCDLPVARGAARRIAGQQHSRVPHAVSLQQLRRHGRSPARSAGSIAKRSASPTGAS